MKWIVAALFVMLSLSVSADTTRIHGSTAAAMAASGHQFDPGFTGVQVSLSASHYNDVNAWSVGAAVQFPAFGDPLVSLTFARAETDIELRGGTVAVTWQWSY